MATTTVDSPVIYLPARRWTRHKLDVPVQVITQKNSKSVVINGRGKEISEGGMAVFAGTELRIGELIAVEFTPPYGTPIRVQGAVRNRNGYCYGVEFLASNPEQTEQVDRLRAILRSSTGFSS